MTYLICLLYINKDSYCRNRNRGLSHIRGNDNHPLRPPLGVFEDPLLFTEVQLRVQGKDMEFPDCCSRSFILLGLALSVTELSEFLIGFASIGVVLI
jgi:hypothetical protein